MTYNESLNEDQCEKAYLISQSHLLENLINESFYHLLSGCTLPLYKWEFGIVIICIKGYLES